MSALTLLAVCLLLGVLAARIAPPTTPQGLNWWVLNIALPALVLELIPKLHFDPQLWFPAAAPWVVFLGAIPFFMVLGRVAGWSRGVVGALILTCGLGNTSFMGYAMVEALRGHAALGAAVIADQLGCFMALATGGVVVAAIYSGARPQPLAILVRVLTFPAFVSFVIGVLVGQLGGWPPLVDDVLHRMGQTLTPLALFSVGFQFQLKGEGGVPLLAGLSWKLLLGPLAVAALGWATGVGGTVYAVGILQAAMAPMISAGILAEQSGLAPVLARRVVGIGIVTSLASVPLWNWLLP